MPWLSWQVLKRAHDALLSELRVQLSNDLVLSAQTTGKENGNGQPRAAKAVRRDTPGPDSRT